MGRGRAWLALLLGLAGLLTLPVAVEVTRRSGRLALLDAGFAIPLALVLSLVALIMARRARENLRWFSLRDGATGLASAAVIVGLVGLCLALTAALSVGFYELVLLYQRSR